ncbi:MAG: rhomboid family intramembrane serine protease [Proteobacteria bacterium]|nr:MAG: rhomboid family intramembrane serine protease [Pseudomonadota bacterium]
MKNHVHRIREELPMMLAFVALIWLVFLSDLVLPGSFDHYGLVPRDMGGLVGIFTMPFLHGNFGHLLSNTVPLLVLLTLLAGSRADSIKVVLVIVILGGLLLWLMGRGASLHIGASGLVFGLAAFLVVSGLLERRPLPLFIAVLVVLLYGSTLVSGLMPWQRGVSWEGHLFGVMAGIAAAWWLARDKQTANWQ